MIIELYETIDEINLGVAKRIKLLRKRQKISQEKLSIKSGVSLGSIKRFETTGEISLKNLTKLATALKCESDIRTLFSHIPYISIEEVVNEKTR